MKVLVIGYGSIGRRHVNNLLAIGIETYVLTSYPDGKNNTRFIKSVRECQRVDYAIIATPTYKHLESLKDIAKNSQIKKVLIEKPAESSAQKALELKRLAEKNGITIFIAYNMRFLKIFDIIKEHVEKNSNLTRLVKISAGQYLPEWRPCKDYKDSYSAHKDMGGGVDLDLSHEIDYMSWIFGKPASVIFILKERISKLGIDSTDYFKGLYRYSNFIVDVELDYLRPKERKLSIIGENRNILEVDFIKRYFKDSDGALWNNEKLFDFESSFIEELKEFLGLNPAKRLCGLDDGISVLKLIEER